MTVSWVRPALADEGTPSGWELTTATGQVTYGRVVFRYDPALADEALQLVGYVPGWWSEIEHALAGDLDDSLTITYVSHSGRIAEGTGMPRWAAGVAHSESGEIVIAQHAPDGSRTDLDGLLRHELAHVALHRATGGQPLPRWFHEGVAESFGAGIDLLRSQTLAGAIFGPGVPPLATLEDNFHGTDAIAATVGYAAARDFVNYLRDRDDKDGAELRQVLTEIRHGRSFDAALVKVYGRTLEELDAEWRSGLTGRYAWFPVISSGGLPLAAVTPLILVAAVRRRRLLRAGWERLAREDAEERALIHAVLMPRALPN
ncbi:MAG: hypothetical protein JNL82_02425 [Myxococcales bacterium]|nr:hypothetical protein [Myxococcales bacterium]